MANPDIKHYEQMLYSLTSYQSGTIGLNKLMADLEGLLNVLEFASTEWKEEFRMHWNDFELVNAMALSRSPPELDARDKNIIRDAVNDLRQLIEKRMEDGAAKSGSPRVD